MNSRTREVDFGILPPQFSYIADAAQRYGIYHGQLEAYIEAVDAFSEDDVRELATVYDEIRRRGDAGALSTWIERNPRGLRGAVRAAFDLFLIFQLLGDRGIAPFRFREVSYSPEMPPRDWTKLPASLAYIASDAEEFGRYEFSDSMQQFLDMATDDQRGRLRAVSARIRERGDASAVFGWLETHSTLIHPEARRLACLVELLDAAGVPIDDAPNSTVVKQIERQVKGELADARLPNWADPDAYERIAREVEDELRTQSIDTPARDPLE